MKKLDKKLKELRKISLEADEKQRMSFIISEYIKSNPVRNTEGVSHIGYKTAKTFYSFYLSIKQSRYMFTSIVIALVFALSGGASLAAEGSLPGDTLYPVKIHVNENIRGAFAVSDESRAEWDAEIVSRRLQEASALKSDDRLDAKTSVNISNQIDAHLKNIEKISTKLEKDKPEAAIYVNTKVEALLKGNIQVLDEVISSEDEDDVIKLMTKLKVGAEAAQNNRERYENQASEDSQRNFENSSKNKIKASSEKIKEVSAYLETKKDSIRETYYSSADSHLSAAVELNSQAEAEYDAGNYQAAWRISNLAFGQAQQAQHIIISGLKINVDLSTEGSLFKTNESENRDDSSDHSDNERENEDDEDDSKSEVRGSKIKIEIKGNTKVEL